MYKFLLVGTVRNTSKNVEHDVLRIHKAFEGLGELSTFLVESDSDDDTVETLKELQKKYPNFSFISLGNLEKKLKNRIERIRFCRNYYVEFIRKEIEVQKWDFIIVADLDGVNSGLTSKAVESNFKILTNWDAIFPNQKFGYYDLLALRCDNWLNHDCFSELEEKMLQANITRESTLKSFRHWNQADKIRQQVIYNQMRKIRVTENPFKVHSAFGGIAIYKPDLFRISNYELIDISNENECEHVSFHLKCEQAGKNLILNPFFVNARFTPYNKNRIKLIRLARYVKMRVNRRTNL